MANAFSGPIKNLDRPCPTFSSFWLNGKKSFSCFAHTWQTYENPNFATDCSFGLPTSLFGQTSYGRSSTTLPLFAPVSGLQTFVLSFSTPCLFLSTPFSIGKTGGPTVSSSDLTFTTLRKNSYGHSATPFCKPGTPS